MSHTKLPDYLFFSDTLKSASLAVTPAELHGLLTGMLSGGLKTDDGRWQPLLFDYTSEGMAWTMAALSMAEKVVTYTETEMNENDFRLSLLLPEGDSDKDLMEKSEALSEWVNHFISGLGLAQLEIKSLSEGSKEALGDLEEIGKLMIDEEDDLNEQSLLLEQVIEHVKVCVLTIHAECGVHPEPQDKKPTLH
ncbi:hypothetical protein VA7868_01761 [Vibrio aerogenes CECT 7868]|uniref:UPF0149 protein VA7868_01761 n=1 Tax=Vibrio aerogenes CECT 7868 TaxID=1216006 RepID=A0A1M5YIW4_9VIBR|nr:YecA family protein [Vibrio aerogenes]SHI11839.1 hypothetical protein VA7868_01761 [Vibrio aerogenes CECT 7868]